MKKFDAFNKDFYNRIESIVAANGKASEDDIDTLLIVFDFCNLHIETAEEFVTAALTFLQLADNDKDRMDSAKKIKQVLRDCGVGA